MKRTYELKDNRTGNDLPEFKTTVDVTMTDTDLIFEFDCKNSKFFSACDEYNGPLFDGDVCEAFISTDGTRKHYFEIEVAPNNAVFLYTIENFGVGKYETTPIPVNFVTSKVEIQGNDYKLMFSVPLEKINYNKDIGILFNIFRIETEGGFTDKNLLAANPTKCPYFHDSSKFFEFK
ncbi:MAG: hypothetical protein E7348_06885 [Clostridiales bacterium]|nr:hypothetical protein [Clostridiales bacterium]